MKHTQLRSKDFNEKILQYQIQFTKKDQIELVETDTLKIILVNKEPAFFYHEEILLPTLKFLQQHSIVPVITVDMGAIPFIIKGADIMRPGIVRIVPKTNKNEPVVVVDQTHHKPLAVGTALYSAEEIQALPKGKVIKNIHYVGDYIWNFS